MGFDFTFFEWNTLQIDGFVQDCSNSSALAMELLKFCAKPSKYGILW